MRYNYVWNYIFVISVIYFKSSLYSTTFIYSIINGTLTDNLRFNFTITASDFRGCIIFGTDSDKNQLEIEVTGGKKKENKKVKLRYNDRNKHETLKRLCGCEACDNSNVIFYIEIQFSIVTIRCNNQYKVSLVTTEKKNSPFIIQTHPMIIVNTTRKILLMIGNIEPYFGLENVEVSATSEQLIGCLRVFYHNNELVSFAGNSAHVLQSCPIICSNNSCNGGVCQSISWNNFTCDCLSTDLNGRYCNRSMNVYNELNNNSFETVNSDNIGHFQFKMTWKHVLPKTYCLLEIVTKYENITIFTTKSQIKVNSAMIYESVKLGVTNHIFVNISNNQLIIKIKNMEYKYVVIFTGRIRINIGFSLRYDDCKTFQGPYDLYYVPSQLRQINHFYSTTDAAATNSSVYERNILSTEWIVLIVVLPALFGALICFVYSRSRKTQDHDAVNVAVANKPGDAVVLEVVGGSSLDYSTIDYAYMYNSAGTLPDVYDYMPMTLLNTELPLLPPRNTD